LAPLLITGELPIEVVDLRRYHNGTYATGEGVSYATARERVPRRPYYSLRSTGAASHSDDRDGFYEFAAGADRTVPRRRRRVEVWDPA
jgi:hypothetical protein